MAEGATEKRCMKPRCYKCWGKDGKMARMAHSCPMKGHSPCMPLHVNSATLNTVTFQSHGLKEAPPEPSVCLSLLVCFDNWSPAGGAVLEDCGILVKRGSVGGQGSPGVGFIFTLALARTLCFLIYQEGREL